MGKEKCHEISFLDVSNDWDTALPVGNGRLGGMVFRRDRELHIAVNHYDCYYRVLPKLHGEGEQGGQTFQDPARFVETYQELCRRADLVRGEDGAERSHYARTLHPAQGTGRPSYRGASYPLGGELLLVLDERVDISHTRLRLRIEEAAVTFEAGSGTARVTAQIVAAVEQDGILLRLSQTQEGLWKLGRLVIPPAAGMESYQEEYEGAGRGLCMRTVYGRNEGKGVAGFTQELYFCAEGLRLGRGVTGNGGCCNVSCSDGEEGRDSLSLERAGSLFTAALSLQPGTGAAKAQAEGLVGGAAAVRLSHQSYWRRFWTGTVRLPDSFLETLWHLQLYLLECSCGRGSAYPEQACGLSGLWDIRRPNMWGSMWYWDVNIQSAFWGVGSAGHPELLKLFCDGYLAYEQDIREYTRKVYGMEGWALDYPHPLYHCIQPWCAQFLWQYYQYSGDREFLERRAYPVFREQLAFFRRLAWPDQEGILHVRYDISPEQGPVTIDSVITISSIRRLAEMAIEAGAILGRPEGELEEIKALKEKLPGYPLTADGGRYKDSLLAPDHIFLRHPSVLMPVFPAEEADLCGISISGSDDKAMTRRRWERTLQYAAEHTETGTFGMGWLAAAAARLGRGRTALRLIYEKGLDYVLHANGLAYEESERFLNYCHLTKPAHYLPVMMEFAGGLVNGVNQMMLQTGGTGEIRVFPAVPDETPDILEPVVQYREDDTAVEGSYENWEEASFAGLLAPGGFRVSAVRSGGITVFLKVESGRDAVLRLELPGELAQDGRPYILERKMKAGEAICWGEEGSGENAGKPGGGACDGTPGVLCHEAARTRRRIFLGADRHTCYYQAVDSFTCAYLLANDYRYAQTPYIFDFGVREGEKDYMDSYPPQLAIAGQCVLYAAGPRRAGVEEYRQETGYGFHDASGIKALDRGGPDALRRDFLEGDQEAVFVLGLPKGKYNLLLICGDEMEASFTQITLPAQGTTVSTGRLEAGRFGCKILPVLQERDGELQCSIRAGEGYKWKLNALFVNKEHSLTS